MVEKANCPNQVYLPAQAAWTQTAHIIMKWAHRNGWQPDPLTTSKAIEADPVYLLEQTPCTQADRVLLRWPHRDWRPPVVPGVFSLILVLLLQGNVSYFIAHDEEVTEVNEWTPETSGGLQSLFGHLTKTWFTRVQSVCSSRWTGSS